MNMHVAICLHMNQMDAANKKPLTLLYRAIYNVFGFSETQLKIRNRTAQVVEARQAFCYCALNDLGYSTNFIGSELKQNHSSVIHSRRVFVERLKMDYNGITDKYARLVEIINS